MDCCEMGIGVVVHRFLGYYQRRIVGGAYAIHRCICGYVEAVPLAGGPSIALNAHFEPILVAWLSTSTSSEPFI